MGAMNAALLDLARAMAQGESPGDVYRALAAALSAEKSYPSSVRAGFDVQPAAIEAIAAAVAAEHGAAARGAAAAACGPAWEQRVDVALELTARVSRAYPAARVLREASLGLHEGSRSRAGCGGTGLI